MKTAQSSFKTFLPLRYSFFFIAFLSSLTLHAQNRGYWQQRIYCQMEIDFDVEAHQYEGSQRLVFMNNSPDTLTRMFYHLYFNAFQSDSEMFNWTSQLPDPDLRILNKLSAIKPSDEGFLKVKKLTQNGQPVYFKENRTILEVNLIEPIPPGQSAVIDMTFHGQVPIQTRRSGRYNAEGIAYSMAQWYPKVCNYDKQGWHANPYVQREFYGVWGDYDVRIHIDKSFILAGSGYIQNPQEVQSGYENPDIPVVTSPGRKKTWHFLAPNVHDFTWSADPNYTHTKHTMQDGTVFHFLYKETKENKEAWTALPEYMDQALLHINKLYGKYPYKQYTIAQGGDGGMEYPMLTLITGNRPLRSLVGVSVHELMHMWYQMVLGSNELLYSWMDEGFTNYSTSEIMAQIFPGEDKNTTQRSNYLGYFGLVASGVEEPLSTHADHYRSNFAYGAAAYNKGAVFLNQLGYILGKETLDLLLLDYYTQWQFKHPTALDFIRVAEKRSDIELDWYYEYWINSTKTIDYSIDSAWIQQGNLYVLLSQESAMPMPIDIAILYEEGNVLRVHIPLDLMRGFKRKDAFFALDYVAPDWPWTSKNYTLVVPGPWPEGTTTIAIDPSRRMADIQTSNNVYKIDLQGS